MSRPLLLAVALLVAPLSAPLAQLSLADALRAADGQAYANRIADADADAQSAQSLSALRGILPTLRVEAGLMATTDPIGAFGTTLRQRAITAADFDPARLNCPDAARNRMAGLVLEQPVFNADAWTGRRAAGAAADATRAMADWTRNSTRVDVVRAYYGATLAAELRETLSAARRAADAHVARAQALADTGLVTRSDALLAQVRAGEVHGRYLEAATDAEHAQRGLAVLLGLPTLPSALPGSLPSGDAVRDVVALDSLEADAGVRSDVAAATAASHAASADALRAKSLYLPRVNGFARYDWNDPTGFFANERAWTVGLMATWTPFAGASEIAEVRTTNARAASARAKQEAATAQATLDVDRSRDRVRVAFAQLAIAESGITQATEAHRIVARKYDGGLATISELLEASATETQARLMHAMARYHLILAAAERRLALGTDLTTLTALDTALSDSTNDR